MNMDRRPKSKTVDKTESRAAPPRKNDFLARFQETGITPVIIEEAGDLLSVMEKEFLLDLCSGKTVNQIFEQSRFSAVMQVRKILHGAITKLQQKFPDRISPLSEEKKGEPKNEQAKTEPKDPSLIKDKEVKETIELRILFADDHQGMRDQWGRLLRARYSHVEVVEDGEKLLDKLAAENFDLVITDFHMGLRKINGMDVLKKIRDTKKTENLPVIIITTDNFPGLKEGIERRGGVYLDKTSRLEEIYAAIDKVTEERNKNMAGEKAPRPN